MGQDYEPAWSPDGTQITFTSGRAGELDVWAVDAPPASSTTAAASFSPLDVGTDSALAASEPRNLTPGSGLKAQSPHWGVSTTLANSAPKITNLRPADGSSTAELRSTIGATVTDAQTNLAKKNLTLSLDDAKVARASFSYDRATDRLRYTPGTNLSATEHTVKVVARDSEGLVTRKSWSFSVGAP